MARITLIAGNWKMFKTAKETASMIKDLVPRVKNVTGREVLICPPFTAISSAVDAAKGSNVMIGAQNMFWEDKGAFTGEIAGNMIKDLGCSHVIIGHSERRQYFGETDETVNKRIFAALKNNLTPIICIGETLAEREASQTLKIIEKQIKGGLKGMTKDQMFLSVVAYEPVWAIGTGKTATPDQAQDVHSFIRKQLSDLFDKPTADLIRILYGGSVKPDNMKDLMSRPDIDGGLVGGASLEAESFAKIVNY